MRLLARSQLLALYGKQAFNYQRRNRKASLASTGVTVFRFSLTSDTSTWRVLKRNEAQGKKMNISFSSGCVDVCPNVRFSTITDSTYLAVFYGDVHGLRNPPLVLECVYKENCANLPHLAMPSA